MKISEMIKNLEEFKAEHGDLDCWYARDDEGNGYQEVYYSPSLMYADEDGEMHNKEDLEEYLEYYELTKEDVAPVCIVN
jgi:hypothetical protein